MCSLTLFVCLLYLQSLKQYDDAIKDFKTYTTWSPAPADLIEVQTELSQLISEHLYAQQQSYQRTQAKPKSWADYARPGYAKPATWGDMEDDLDEGEDAFFPERGTFRESFYAGYGGGRGGQAGRNGSKSSSQNYSRPPYTNTNNEVSLCIFRTYVLPCAYIHHCRHICIAQG